MGPEGSTGRLARVGLIAGISWCTGKLQRLLPEQCAFKLVIYVKLSITEYHQLLFKGVETEFVLVSEPGTEDVSSDECNSRRYSNSLPECNQTVGT